MNQQGDITWKQTGIFLLIVMVLYTGYVLLQNAARECISDADCGSDFYCGADNQCHRLPIIEKRTETSNLLPAFILAAGLIVAALILRKKR